MMKNMREREAAASFFPLAKNRPALTVDRKLCVSEEGASEFHHLLLLQLRDCPVHRSAPGSKLQGII